MGASNLEEALDRYLAQVRRERRLGADSGEPGSRALQTSSVKGRAEEIVSEESALSAADQDEIESLVALDLKAIAKASIGIPDAVQGESDYLALLVRMGGAVAVRSMAMDALFRLYSSGRESTEAVIAKATSLGTAIDDLEAAFQQYDRDGFQAVVNLTSGTVVTTASQLQVAMASMVGRAKTLGTFAGFGFDCTDLCDKIDALFDAVLGPNTFISALYALIAKIESLITDIIDLLLEILDLVDAALAIRGNLEDSNPAFNVHLRVMNTGLEKLNEFLAGVPEIAKATAYQRGEVLRNLVLRLKAIQSGFCRSVCTDNQTTIQFSIADGLLSSLFSALNPIRNDLADLIDRFKEGSREWLLAFKSHVQRDMTGFNSVLIDVRGEISIVLNLAGIIKAAVSGPTFPVPDRVNAGDALESNGMDSVTDEYNRGNVTILEKISVETGTLAGVLANFLGQKKQERRAAGTLSSAEETVMNELENYLHSRQRARIQSSAIQASLTSENIDTRDSDLANAEAVAEAVRPFVEEDDG